MYVHIYSVKHLLLPYVEHRHFLYCLPFLLNPIQVCNYMQYNTISLSLYDIHLHSKHKVVAKISCDLKKKSHFSAFANLLSGTLLGGNFPYSYASSMRQYSANEDITWNLDHYDVITFQSYLECLWTCSTIRYMYLLLVKKNTYCCIYN